MFLTKSGHNSEEDDNNPLVFDITDEETGQLHATARLHIPPFVNEITDPSHTGEEQSVHPAFDCQGAFKQQRGSVLIVMRTNTITIAKAILVYCCRILLI